MSRELEGQVLALTTSKQSLEAEVERGRVAMDSVHSELEFKHKEQLESLANQCQEYQQKIGKNCRVSYREEFLPPSSITTI